MRGNSPCRGHVPFCSSHINISALTHYIDEPFALPLESLVSDPEGSNKETKPNICGGDKIVGDIAVRSVS